MQDSRKVYLGRSRSQMVGNNKGTQQAHPTLRCIGQPPLQDSRLPFQGGYGQTRESPEDSNNRPKHEHMNI